MKTLNNRSLTQNLLFPVVLIVLFIEKEDVITTASGEIMYPECILRPWLRFPISRSNSVLLYFRSNSDIVGHELSNNNFSKYFVLK